MTNKWEVYQQTDGSWLLGYGHKPFPSTSWDNWSSQGAAQLYCDMFNTAGYTFEDVKYLDPSKHRFK